MVSVAANDVFIASQRSWVISPLATGGRTGPFTGPLYEMFPWLQIATIGTTGIGIGQAAVDELIALAAVKTPSYTGDDAQ